MTSSDRKPVGGIVAVTLFFSDEQIARSVPLTEERSSYTEEIISDAGVVRVHHTLTLVIPRAKVAPFVDLVPQLAGKGVTAYITTAAGEKLTVGQSDRFFEEQLLRMTSLTLGTGIRPADGNDAVLRLESDDTSALTFL